MFDEKEAPGLGFPFAKAICLADVRRYHFADVRQVLSVTCTRGNLNQLYVVVCSLFYEGTFVRTNEGIKYTFKG